MNAVVKALKETPSLASVPGIGKEQLSSLFAAAALFEGTKPYKILDNSFILRINVRVSDSHTDWTPGTSVVTGAGDPEMRIFNIEDVCKARMQELDCPEPAFQDRTITLSTIVAGNTDYEGRGLYAYEGFDFELAHNEYSHPKTLVMWIYPDSMSSQGDVQKVREWRLPTKRLPGSGGSGSGSGGVELLKVFHAPFSLNQRYSVSQDTEEAYSNFTRAARSLPDAEHLRWLDAALRAVVEITTSQGIVYPHPRGGLAYPSLELELRLPSWHMHGAGGSSGGIGGIGGIGGSGGSGGSGDSGGSSSSGSGASCYAYVRVLLEKSYDPILNGEGPLPWSASYYPGGLLCYYCGSPPIEGSTSEKLLVCSKCRKIKYCSKGCQIKDWPRHRRECGQAGYQEGCQMHY